MINRIQLEPIEIVKQETMYMVPLIRSPNKYEVFIANKYLRIFTDETLPSYIKSALSMAEVASTSYAKDSEVTNWDLFICRVPNMDYVGWRASESVYIIILNEEQLNTIRGERHDT